MDIAGEAVRNRTIVDMVCAQYFKHLAQCGGFGTVIVALVGYQNHGTNSRAALMQMAA